MGALAVCPVATVMIATIGLRPTLMILGLVFTAIVVTAAQVFRPAPEPTTVRGSRDSAMQSHTLGEALCSAKLYLLWLMLGLNVMAGTAWISVAAPLAQSLTGVTAQKAALTVIVISICNVAGRLICGCMSDWLGRPMTFVCLFAI
jgi:MFS transporter, OFA family, oxalate/formate antiporter